MIETLNLQHAFDQHDIKLIKKLSYNAYLCGQEDGRPVVLKAGDRVTFERNTRTKDILTFLESHPFKNTLVPQFVGMSEREDKNQYIITTFQEASEPEWSEFDGDEKLGGKLISIEYVDDAISAAEDLFACPVFEINFLASGTNSLDSVAIFVKSLHERGALMTEAFQEIMKIIESQKNDYFSKNMTISNGDFYPRNLLIADIGKPYLIDWDGFLTGGIEEGDTLEDTVRKEIREETGFKNVASIKPYDFVSHGLFFHPVKNVNRLAHYHLVFAQLADLEAEEVSEEEKGIADFNWFPKEAVLDLLTRNDMRLLWRHYIESLDNSQRFAS